jgi:hypothetical protein
VRDNGIGIPKHALGTVFDMFSQLKPALDRSKGGLGIGLALVRGILALHGGSIGVESAGRRPRQHLHGAPAAGPGAGDAGHHCPASDAVAPASVLVVDDNVDAAETLQMFLELSGCLARVAHSAGEALDVLDQFQPQVALFDIGCRT